VGYWGWRGVSQVGVFNEKLLLEVLGGDFIQRTRSDPRRGDAQGFGLGKNFFVLQAELL